MDIARSAAEIVTSAESIPALNSAPTSTTALTDFIYLSCSGTITGCFIDLDFHGQSDSACPACDARRVRRSEALVQGGPAYISPRKV
ncbi:hypothetical protein EVAR_6714_1 [Eumeta japonica]|uniref:Uncharacterized protein n=1 Tax=Eumeta variegata TaxID=151549 RepID=A0A4C1V4S2_EUMVA|nr:hypothetical protein EVAR_6714_1 [Eumeta japonica]